MKDFNYDKMMQLEQLLKSMYKITEPGEWGGSANPATMWKGCDHDSNCQECKEAWVGIGELVIKALELISDENEGEGV